MAKNNNIIDEFVYKNLKLIDLDHNQEIQQNKRYQQKLSLLELQNRGICLIKLCKHSIRTGLYGRRVVTFGSKWTSKPLPSNGISSGDVVGVTANNDSLVLVSGVVLKVLSLTIDVAFDEDISAIDDREDNQSYNLVKISNDVTHRRLKSALNLLKKNSFSHQLIQCLFGETEITLNSNEDKTEINYFNPNLNESQKNAIDFAINQKEVAIIHGPPGTGKTTALIEIILQSVRNSGLRVLACAQSNTAVDNILEKLSDLNESCLIRLGHPARAFTRLQKYSLDAAIARTDEYKIVCDMRSEIEGMVTQRNSSFSEIKSLRKELKSREKKVLKEVLENSRVVLTTLTSGSTDGPLKSVLNSDGYYPFDLVVIDECSQAIEASVWIVLNCAHKCVIAGDHLQLPPTIISEEAAKKGLEISLMERLIKQFKDKQIVRMLDIQYRMNEQIMNWSSKQFYSNQLKAHESVEKHTLNDLIKGTDISPMVLIDTSGCDMNELDLEDEESKGNEFEADIVSIYVQRLIKKGFPESSIGIISPYNLQVQLMRARLKDYENIEIKSVDGFQGREKEIIILSFVRSNDRREVGFLSERRRINVAVTRAKRHLALVCDSDTVCNDPTIETLIEHFHQNGDIVCAQEFIEEMQVLSDIKRPSNLRFKTKESLNKSRTETQKKSKEQKQKIDFCAKNIEKDSIILLKETEFESKLKKFISEKDCNVLAFPSDMSSFDRLLVHRIAESLDLIHESVGEGEDRHIVIHKKITKNSNESENNICVQNNTNLENIETNTKPENQTNLFGVKSKIKNTKINSNSVKEKTKSNNKTKNNNKSENVKKTIELSDNEDIDSMIAKVKKCDNICNYLKCKTNITVLGQKCQFCGHRFCMTHAMPEVHSKTCTDMIRAQVKSQARKDGKLYPGSGAPEPKKLDSHKRQYLEKKLSKKLNQFSDKRKTKKSEEK